MTAETDTVRGFALEPSAEERRRMGELALDHIDAFLGGLAHAPASNVDGSFEYARTLRDPAPREGTRDVDAVLARVREAASYGFETAGPGYLAFIPGGGLWTAALADFLATSFNRFVNIAPPAPAFAQMEATVLRWFGDLFEHPVEAGGLLTSGGSMANFSAIVSARRAKLPEDFLRGTLYASEQTHASVSKAAMLAGFPQTNVRAVPTDERLRVDVAALVAAIERDRADGYTPFCVVANAGTTNTGAVDPIADIADVTEREGMWLHVDGAYGGFFQLTARGRTAFAGVERADSVTLDPHKGLFLPYGTGCLLVRDRAALHRAHRVGADYLQDIAGADEVPNFSDYSPELSRDFRGLRVWLPLVLHGFDAFAAALDEKLDLARLLYASLRDAPGIDVPWDPDLTVVAFRARPSSGDADAASRALLERINASRRVFLSSTLIHGRFTIRACILSHRTHRDRIEEAAEIIRSAARDVAS